MVRRCSWLIPAARDCDRRLSVGSKLFEGSLSPSAQRRKQLLVALRRVGERLVVTFERALEVPERGVGRREPVVGSEVVRVAAQRRVEALLRVLEKSEVLVRPTRLA